MGGYFGDMIRAVGFLSRIPMPARFFSDGAFRLTRTVRAFPLAGFLIALPAAILLLALLAMNVSPLFAAFAALGLQTLVTGALHEDGLADTADGFWGGRDKARIMEIMHDSRTGVYGVCALILSFGLRASALASIAATASPLAATLTLLAAETLSRAAIVLHWALTRPARNDGVAASAGQPEGDAVTIALLSSALIALLLGFAISGPLPAFAFPAVAAAATYGFTSLVKNKIGGHTGDTLGACQQITTIAVLFTATIAS